MPQPWDRLDGEHHLAYQAFLFYRDMGPMRNVPACYRQCSGNLKAKQANGTYNRWSKQFRWFERAVAYDAHLYDLRKSSEAKAIVATGFDLAKEKHKAVKATLEYGDLLLRRGKVVLDWPLADKTVKRKVQAASGETFDLETTYEAVDARNLAAAARIGQIGSEMIWAAIDRAEDDTTTAGDDELSLGQHAAAVREAERLWANWEADLEARRAAAAARPQLMPPDQADTPPGTAS